MSIQRVILPVSLAIFLATSTQLLSMDRGAQTIISSGVGYTSIEESELLDFGLGAMFALDRDGIFAVGVSAGWLNDLGDNEEEGYQLGASISFFPTDKLQLSLGLNYVSTEFDTWVSGYTSNGNEFYSSWTAESTAIGGNFDIKYRLISARENISPYLVAGIGVSKPDIEDKNGYTLLYARPGYYFKKTGNKYNSVNNAFVDYDLSNVLVAQIGAGVDFALTRNVGLNLYFLVGTSQYDHEVSVYDSTYSISDSTVWSLGASIKWYLGGARD